MLVLIVVINVEIICLEKSFKRG